MEAVRPRARRIVAPTTPFRPKAPSSVVHP
jgi:hypothetical protein